MLPFAIFVIVDIGREVRREVGREAAGLSGYKLELEPGGSCDGAPPGSVVNHIVSTPKIVGDLRSCVSLAEDFHSVRECRLRNDLCC